MVSTILYFFVSKAQVAPIIEALLFASGEKRPNTTIELSIENEEPFDIYYFFCVNQRLSAVIK